MNLQSAFPISGNYIAADGSTNCTARIPFGFGWSQPDNAYSLIGSPTGVVTGYTDQLKIWNEDYLFSDPMYGDFPIRNFYIEIIPGADPAYYGNFTIQTGAPGVAGRRSYGINIVTGNTTGGGGVGSISVRPGGASGSFASSGGFLVTAGQGTSGAYGGGVSLAAGSGDSGGGYWSGYAGTGTNGGNGGNTSLSSGGVNGATGTPGTFNLSGGSIGNSANTASGGSVTITGGTTYWNFGGGISLNGGLGFANASFGGSISATGGTAQGTGNGGNISLLGGAALSTGTGGIISFRGGASTSGNYGYVGVRETGQPLSAFGGGATNSNRRRSLFVQNDLQVGGTAWFQGQVFFANPGGGNLLQGEKNTSTNWRFRNDTAGRTEFNITDTGDIILGNAGFPISLPGDLTIKTSLTGIVKAASGVIGVASSSDLLTAIGDAAADGTTKGIATFTAADFNSSAGLISIDYTNGQAASGANKGFLTSADWTTFNNKVATTRAINTTSPITGGGDLSADRTLAFDFSTNNTWTGTNHFSLGISIPTGEKVYFEGAASDTYITYNSGSGYLEIYVNGNLAGEFK